MNKDVKVDELKDELNNIKLDILNPSEIKKIEENLITLNSEQYRMKNNQGGVEFIINKNINSNIIL